MRSTKRPWLRAGRLAPVLVLLGLATATHSANPALAAVLDNGTSVEGCVGCHAAGRAVPVGNIADPRDAHSVALGPRGPASAAGYRQLDIVFATVDVTGSKVVLDFSVQDEAGAGVADLFASDGRFNVAKLVLGEVSGDPTEWKSLLFSERFTTQGGVFEALGGGAYRYTSVFDPSSVPVATGDTLRVSVQISAGDLPAGNGWCDFDADLAAANACTSPPTASLTRDIVQTSVCNDCHGATSDTRLSFHGGGRTEVEYCVSCHNPDIGETDMTPLIHKIHYGSQLSPDFRDGKYEHVQFTKEIDNCTSCHAGAGADVDNWKQVPNRVACGSCHEDVNFDTGEGHGDGGQQLTNRFCGNCHPAEGDWTESVLPVSAVHQGLARAQEAGRYRGEGNGYAIESLIHDRAADTLTVDYSVTRDGAKMSLQSDPEWAMGGSLRLRLGWSTEEYTNEGSASAPAPAQPLSFDALDVGGAVMDLGTGSYRTQLDVPDEAFGNLIVFLEGRPVASAEADLRGNRTIPVQNAFANVNVELREPVTPRRQVVDMALCNTCHDTAGAGLALHGNNRVNEMQACVVCHNNDTTDIGRRPEDPEMSIDGKREESVDIKRMVHQIHTGKGLQNGYVAYGFGGTPHDYSFVDFIGNTRNCLTCHEPGTYSTEAAWLTLASTIDTGEELADPSDDLNISQISAVCSSCHDDDRAVHHMVLNGASFMAVDGQISLPTPEPDGLVLGLAACGVLAGLARRRRR